MKKILNIEYSMIQGSYWMYYGTMVSFASVFLLEKNYTNANIGTIFALANIGAVIIQPLIANIGDKVKKITLPWLIESQAIFLMAMSACLLLFREKSIVLTVIFISLIAWHTAIHPLINSLAFYLEKSGSHINFGICRGVGSLAYALLTAVLGTIVEAVGVKAIPVTAILIMLIMISNLGLVAKHFSKEVNRREDKKEEKLEEIKFADFVRNNLKFFVFSIGVIGLFFGNAVLNNFMIQIVSDVGGSKGDMGRMLGLMAALELPGLIFFDQIKNRFSCRLLLKISATGFFLKIGIMCIAESVTMLYIAQFCQVIAFGLFLPAMVHFINEIMEKAEALRGQAVYTIMTTIGAIFASFFGGMILDTKGPHELLVISTILTAIGGLVIVLLVDKIKPEKGNKKEIE